MLTYKIVILNLLQLYALELNNIIFLSILSNRQEHYSRKNSLKYHGIILGPYCPPLQLQEKVCKPFGITWISA